LKLLKFCFADFAVVAAQQRDRGLPNVGIGRGLFWGKVAGVQVYDGEDVLLAGGLPAVTVAVEVGQVDQVAGLFSVGAWLINRPVLAVLSNMFP